MLRIKSDVGDIEMNMEKFYELLIGENSIKDIPLTYVLRVTLVILEIINSGDCMYDTNVLE